MGSEIYITDVNLGGHTPPLCGVGVTRTDCITHNKGTCSCLATLDVTQIDYVRYSWGQKFSKKVDANLHQLR